jgi:hypothetical protein
VTTGVAAFGSAPYKACQGGHVRPGPPAGRRGRRGGGAGSEEEKGREPGAEEGARGGFYGRGRRRLRGAGPRRRRRRRRRTEGPAWGRESAARRKPKTARGPVVALGGSRAAAAPSGTAAREVYPAAPAAAAAAAGPGSLRPGRPAGAGGRDGAAARAPRARSPQPSPGGTGGYCARAHPFPLVLRSPRLGRVPFRKWPGMRSPAASQPGQRFLRQARLLVRRPERLCPAD